MITNIVVKNYKLTQHFEDVLNKKVSKLDKFFYTDTEIKVLCKQTNYRKDKDMILELTVAFDYGYARVEVASDNMYDNIDLAIPKLEKQIIKHYSKIVAKHKKSKLKNLDSTDLEISKEQTEKKIVKTKSFSIVAMSIEDAISQLELLGHSFFVYRDSKTLKISIVYARKDGDYGSIELDEDKKM